MYALPDSAPDSEAKRNCRGEGRRGTFNRAYSCGLPSRAQTPPVCICLCTERCFAAQGELCSGRQAVVASTAHLEIWSGLYFCQNTRYCCGILHLAQMMGQASCCGDMRNRVTAMCLPLLPPPTTPAHPKRMAGEEAAAQSSLKNTSLSFPVQCPQWHQEHCHQMLEGMKAGLGFPSSCSRWWLSLHGKGGHQTIPSGKERQENLPNSVCHPAVLAFLPALLKRMEPSPAAALHPPHLSLSISSARRP